MSVAWYEGELEPSLYAERKGPLGGAGPGKRYLKTNSAYLFFLAFFLAGILFSSCFSLLIAGDTDNPYPTKYSSGLRR
jgi:hypothetical protein